MAKDETFDADAFMTSTIDAPLDTDFPIMPEGTYQAMIEDFDCTAIEKVNFTYKQGDRAGQPGSMLKFSIPYSIQDQAALAKLGRSKMVVEQQLTLDMDSTGQLDFGQGKNVRLGQVRAAVNQNQKGPWSVSNLRGQGPVMVQVAHEQFKRRDGSEGKAARVIRVVALRS